MYNANNLDRAYADAFQILGGHRRSGPTHGRGHRRARRGDEEGAGRAEGQHRAAISGPRGHPGGAGRPLAQEPRPGGGHQQAQRVQEAHRRRGQPAEGRAGQAEQGAPELPQGDGQEADPVGTRSRDGDGGGAAVEVTLLYLVTPDCS